MALAAAERSTGAYSEVILGLPGDSKAKHFASLRRLVDAGFGRVNMFQLSLLPGSDLCADEARARHQMSTRFRAMPRCAGRYDVLGDTVTTVEVDEVCVSIPDLPYEDYLQCRLMNLLVGVFFNDGGFSALVQGLRACQVPVFDWLARMHDTVRGRLAAADRDAFTHLAAAFLAATDRQL